jgi:hypothetical protein
MLNMFHLIKNMAAISNHSNYVLENKTPVVFCVLSWHKNPALCDGA